MAAFTIVYRFMWNLLHLDGYSKLIYATIFGFWIKSNTYVYVPYSAIRTITGATAPTISDCVGKLEKAGLIEAKRSTGRRTGYKIIMADAIWTAYLSDAGKEAAKEVKGVNQINNPPKVNRAASKISEVHKKRDIKREMKGMSPNSNSDSNRYSVDSRIASIELMRINTTTKLS